MAAARPRRGPGKKQLERAAHLEALRQGKQQKRSEAFHLIEEKDVYTTVTEDEYKSMVQKRRGEEFVVDDDGLGYYDDGEEHLFDSNAQRDRKRKNAGRVGALTQEAIKRARLLDQKKKGEAKKVNSMFLGRGQSVGPGSKTITAATDAADDDFLNDLLGELDEPMAPEQDAASLAAAAKRKAKLLKKRKMQQAAKLEELAMFTSNTEEMTKAHDKMQEEEAAAEAAALAAAQAAAAMQPAAQQPAAAPARAAAAPSAHSYLAFELPEMPDMDVDLPQQAAAAAEGVAESAQAKRAHAKQRLFRRARGAAGGGGGGGAASAPPQLKASAALQSKAAPPTPAPAAAPVAQPKKKAAPKVAMPVGSTDGWFQSSAAAAATPAAVSHAPAGLPLKKEGKDSYLDMFWIDVVEVPRNPGTLFVFGKVWVEQQKAFLSCCVTVQNLEHVITVLPRDGDDFINVYKEMDGHIRKLFPKGQQPKWRARSVKRTYCFENPDVPRTTKDYLEARYPARLRPLNDKLQGDTFSHVFGTRARAIETFIMQRDLMGPCWIRVKNPTKQANPASWCKFDVSVVNAECISRMKATDAPPSPPLVVASISLKTVVNPASQTHEIVMASVLTHSRVEIDGPTPNSASGKGLAHFTCLRSPGGPSGNGLPMNFRNSVRANPRWNKTLEATGNERALLNFLVAKLHMIDPDVIVGHNIYNFGLDVLLHRMKACKVASWSKLGRLRLRNMPREVSKGDKQSFVGNLVCGRLVCDTYLSARELVRETSYTLGNLSASRLGVSRQKMDPQDVPAKFAQSQQLLHLAHHTENDAWLALRIMWNLQCLPLTKQITNLAGNLWNRTLKGARAERVEYLLLHEFKRQDYIVPEKKPPKRNSKPGRRKKAAYAGGLVLEPKKGLYDKYVLLLDFNSLYPSIIQEYNICFTTVERQELNRKAREREAAEEAGTNGQPKGGPAKAAAPVEEDTLPDVPPSTMKFGVLPRVIQHLVQRRAQVKKLLKVEKDGSKKKQLDIRQKALKILANSMYGCLGFSFSRFYAKPLAALVTSRGRQILQNTVDLARTQGYDVIYGDTDSIMVNTNSTSLPEVMSIGAQIKKAVNAVYKLLVIEIDGVYKTMLLLKKKKYAALVVNQRDGQVTYDRELKGLDMVRRDWCPLSKDAGGAVLDLLMSGRAKEEVIEGIHSGLIKLAESVRSGAIPLEKFVITKGINKAPHEYPNAKSQAHLQVALWMIKQGKPVNAGDHIPYVVCKGESKTAAERARHPDRIRREASGASAVEEEKLEVDKEWYLGNQILPPISRLCAVIDGLSTGSLAEALGLDSRRFQVHDAYNKGGNGEDDWDFVGESQLSDAERFKDVEPLRLACTNPKCRCQFNFSGAVIGVHSEAPAAAEQAKQAEQKKNKKPPAKGEVAAITAAAPAAMTAKGVECPTCHAAVHGSAIVNSLELAMRQHTKHYYNGELRCIDPACGTISRSLRGASTIEGQACMVIGCHSAMVPVYSAQKLYNQLKYFQALFDVERGREKLQEENDEREATAAKTKTAVTLLPDLLPKAGSIAAQDMEMIKEFVSERVEDSAYNWIKPDLWKTVFV